MADYQKIEQLLSIPDPAEKQRDLILSLNQEIAALNARIAWLEQECETLLLAKGKWQRSAFRIAELANFERQDFLTKLEALRKDAKRWRYIRANHELDGDVFATFNEWFWAQGPLEDVEAAIDAAMLGVSE